MTDQKPTKQTTMEMIRNSRKNPMLESGPLETSTTSVAVTTGSVPAGKLTYCKFVISVLSFRAFVCMILSIAIGVEMMYAYLTFTSRPLLILFTAVLAFALPCYFILIFSCAFFSCHFTKDDEIATNETEQEDKQEIKQKNKAKELLHAVFHCDGKYYVLKTYVSELCEYAAQINAIDVYMCSFPVSVCVTFFIALAMEAAYISADTYRSKKYGMSTHRRNNRIFLDVVLEVMLASIPLLILNFGYKLPFTIDEFVKVGIVPAFFAILKIKEITNALIREKTAELLAKNAPKSKAKENFLNSWVQRTKTKMNELDENSRISLEQMKHTPEWAHVIFVTVTLMYAIFLIIVASVQVGMGTALQCSYGSDKGLVWNSCSVKVPFCKTIWQPHCNCAILNVERHNWTKLPPIVGEMVALKKVTINHGPMSNLKGIEDLTRLSYINLNYNQLELIPNSVGNFRLTFFACKNNRLHNVPKSIWGNKHVVQLSLSNNYITTVPDFIHNAVQLRGLFLSNNSIIELPTKHMSKLWDLFIDGNKMNKFPSISEIPALRQLRVHNNKNISNIPDSISILSRLEELDARNNMIAELPISLLKLKKLKYFYLHENPVCKNGWLEKNSELKKMVEANDGAGCSKQCSPHFQDRFFELKICAAECNSLQCSFCRGKCN
jgi:hypothetical protein